ncbi:hypothetical protein ACERII_05125 [Evansella sp. AB-rgal1]|uniref:hypothetical protein n=1 Tax=Evansella sp. AB-rgal1 TaxID=3242696 RepID=UPI00359EF913
MKKIAFLYVLMVLLIIGCSGIDDVNDSPLALISDEFDYPSFNAPQEWDVITVTEELEMKKHDLYNPENNEFYDIPLSYIIEFGKKTEENEYNQEEYLEILNAQNEEQGKWGKTILYAHSSKEDYGSLGIGREPYPRLDSRALEDEDFLTEEISIEGVDVVYSQLGNNHLFLWERDKLYYDLYILETSQKLEEILDIVGGFIEK